MITLKQWLETVEYKISEGQQYGWDCFGPNAFIMDAAGANANSCCIVFDTVDHTVYEVSASDETNGRYYRLINPSWVDAYHAEEKRRHISDWDDSVTYVDLETDEDYLEKAAAILKGQSYDQRIVLPLDIGSDTAFALMRMAHERDITFNQLMTEILTDAANRALHNQPV